MAIVSFLEEHHYTFPSAVENVVKQDKKHICFAIVVLNNKKYILKEHDTIVTRTKLSDICHVSYEEYPDNFVYYLTTKSQNKVITCSICKASQHLLICALSGDLSHQVSIYDY